MRTICALLFMLLLPTAAFAQTSAKLLPYAPKESKMLMGADIQTVKSSMLFKEAMKFLKANAQKDSALHFVLTTDTFSFDKDVSSVLVASQAATITPKGATPGESIVIVAGTFDAEKVKAAAMKKFPNTVVKKQGFDVAQFGQFEMAAIESNKLMFAEKNFAKAAWSNAKSKSSSVTKNSKMNNLVKLTDTSRGAWAVMDAGNIPSQEGQPKMNGSTVSASLASGIDLIVTTVMDTAKGAKSAAEELNKAVKTQGGVASMFGGKPLVDNLKVKATKKNVKLTTHMTNAELKTMMATLKKMNAAPAAQKETNPQPIPTRTDTKKGAEADFN